MYILMNGAPHAGILHSFCRNAKKGYTSAFMLLVSTSSRLSSPYFLGPKKVEEMKKYGQSKRKPPFSSFPFQIHTPSTLKTFFVSLWTFFKFSSYLYISQTSSSRRLGPQLLLNFKFSLLMPVLESFLPLFNRHPANDKIIIFLCKLWRTNAVE